MNVFATFRTSDRFRISFLFLLFLVPLPSLCAGHVGGDDDEVENLDEGENGGAEEEPEEPADLPEQTEEVKAGLLLYPLRTQTPVVYIHVQEIWPEILKRIGSTSLLTKCLSFRT